jgi:hypothetical protein
VNGGDDGTRTHDPLVANQVLYQLSYVPASATQKPTLQVVGLGGLEPPTLRLSGVRSNHLSYRPTWTDQTPRATLRRGKRIDSVTEEKFGWPREDLRASPCSVPKHGRACSAQCAEDSLKGGDPAAGSPTATLLRLSPNHRARLRRRPPCGWTSDFGRSQLSWLDGRCVQGSGTYSPRRS